MQRIATPSAVDGKFVEESPGQPKTLTSAEWWNAVQDELVAVIEDARSGQTLDRFNLGQLAAAIDALILFELGASDLFGSFQTLTSPATLAAGDGYHFGTGTPDERGIFGVATEAVTAGNPVLFRMKGNAILPKDTTPGATAFVPGQVVYWSLSGTVCHDDGAGGDRRIIGYARTTEGFLDPTVQVRLNGTTEIPT